MIGELVNGLSVYKVCRQKNKKMKKHIISTFAFALTSLVAFSQQYNDYFTSAACRIDFMFCGNAVKTDAHLVKIKKEPEWGGRKKHLSENLNLGQYRVQVFDSLSNSLIYTEGFSTLYFEWLTTAEAKKVSKCFEQSVQFPYPKKSVKVLIDKRLDIDKWENLMQFSFSPDDKLISNKPSVTAQVKEIFKNTPPDGGVDIAVIAEGYTEKEIKKFYDDARKLAESLFTHEPFKSYRNRINVYAVAAVSLEKGISMPHKDDWKKTAVGSHYYTFYEPRYLTTPNVFSVRDYASLVPYDAIYILANTLEYGGGGIYNFYALASAGSKRAKDEVIVHEFGHSFAGLADEYFREGADVLDAMYDIKQEPWEPNITSLVNFDIKWKTDLNPSTPVPTPVNEENKSKLGVFEGGGYLTKGMFRPAFDCRMRTNEAKAFCPVCTKSVEKVILFLTE